MENKIDPIQIVDPDILAQPILLPSIATTTTTTTTPRSSYLHEAKDALPNLLPAIKSPFRAQSAYVQFVRAIEQPKTFAWIERGLPKQLNLRLFNTSKVYKEVKAELSPEAEKVVRIICAILAAAVTSPDARLFALSIQLQIDSLASSLPRRTPSQDRQQHALFAHFSGLAREVVAHSFLEKGGDLAVAAGYALNPEALFFGSGSPLACPCHNWKGCGRPLDTTDGYFRQQAINKRISVGSHHSRADETDYRQVYFGWFPSLANKTQL